MKEFGQGNRARKETRAPLGGNFGPDSRRRLVVELVVLSDDDVIMFRPKGTRQIVYLRAVDAYRQAIRNKALRAQLEKANAAKARKAEARANRRWKRELRNGR